MKSHGDIFKEEYTKDMFPETMNSILHKFEQWLKQYNLFDLYAEKWKCKYQEVLMVGTQKHIINWLLEQDNTKFFEIKEKKTTRSLQQNKLLWELIHKIAKKQNQDDMEVYCALLERADALSDYIITATEMEDALRKTFRGVKFIRKQVVNDKECNIYKVYIGSSKMNTKEMTELLDITIQLCSELQIPTLEV